MSVMIGPIGYLGRTSPDRSQSEGPEKEYTFYLFRPHRDIRDPKNGHLLAARTPMAATKEAEAFMAIHSKGNYLGFVLATHPRRVERLIGAGVPGNQYPTIGVTGYRHDICWTWIGHGYSWTGRRLGDDWGGCPLMKLPASLAIPWDGTGDPPSEQEVDNAVIRHQAEHLCVEETMTLWGGTWPYDILRAAGVEPPSRG